MHNNFQGQNQFNNQNPMALNQIPPNILDTRPELQNILKQPNPNSPQKIQINNNRPIIPIQVSPQINSNNNIVQNQQFNRNINQQINPPCYLCNQKEAQIIQMNQKINELKKENEKLEEHNKMELTNNLKLSEDLLTKETQMQQELQAKDKQLKEKEEKINDLELELRNEKQRMDNSQEEKEKHIINKQQDEINQLTKTKLELQAELTYLQQQLNKQNEQMDNFKNQLEEKNNKITYEETHTQQRNKEINNLKEEMKKLQQQLMIEEEEKKKSYVQYKKKYDELGNLKKLYREQEEELQEQQNLNKELKYQIDKLIYQPSNSDQTKNEIQIQQEQWEQREQQKLEEKAIKKKQEQERIEFQRNLELESKKKQDLEKQQKIQFGKNLKQKMLESHGQIEVCFVIDVTLSMDEYKKITIQCIQESMKSIKANTNRDTSFSAVCYQDFFEKSQLPNKLYQQHDLTKDCTQIQEFLSKIKCNGGDDIAEDVAGGLQQMCDKISWQKPFRVAMLICDAPAHGNTFTGAGLWSRVFGAEKDDHPDKGQDLINAIKLMIQKQIVLIGLNLTKDTTTMYKEIQKIYEQSKRPDLFYQCDLTNGQNKDILEQMILNIGQAAVSATQTNRKETKCKNDQPVKVIENKGGAIEALYKTGNFFDFDKSNKIQIIKQQFHIHSVSLNDESFQNDFTNLQRLKYPNDYKDKPEGTWNCVRTKFPFAQGKMKDVYLMKKTNNQVEEVYVIKTPLGGKPYPSKEKAIEECRSHLISQSLMRMFMKDIKQACEDKGMPMIYPTVIYTDFLILVENPNSFWIAERFFKGEFVKYNNNFGYIREDNSVLNQMAQAFSYYTYFKSNFNYMINDVQGIGTYFTDPAINTIEGKFDETDMGQDGQGMFMVTYDLRKGISAPILKELLGIDDDD